MLYLSHTMPPWESLCLEHNLGKIITGQKLVSVATEFSGIRISPFHLSFQFLMCSLCTSLC